MPVLNLTARVVESLKPPADKAQIDYFDSGNIPGFGLRISKGGKKTWILLFRVSNSRRLRRLSLGPFPALSLSDAREKARTALAESAHGKDPAKAKREDRRAETFAELSAIYCEEYASKKKSGDEDIRIINRELLPFLGSQKVKEIERGEIRNILARIVERGSPIQANRCLAVIRKIFNFALSEERVTGLQFNPCQQIKAPGKENSRDRVLTMQELKSIWNAIQAEDTLIASIFRLYILTAQRGGEICSIARKDIDLISGWWTIPAHQAKNGLSHRVPLVPEAVETIKPLLEKNSASPWLFPSPKNKEHHIENIQKAVQRIRKNSQIDFTAHDFRRSTASYIASLGVPRLVVSKILNHVEAGVTKIYDRHSYDAEKKDALQKWTDHLKQGLSQSNGSAGQIDSSPEVDLPLIMLNLSLSYEERIRRHDEAARFCEDLRQAGKALIYA